LLHGLKKDRGRFVERDWLLGFGKSRNGSRGMGDRIVIARQRSMSRRATRGQTNPRWDFLRPLDVRCV